MLRKISFVVLPFLLVGCQPLVEEDSHVHHNSLSEAAMIYGAQSGLAWKSKRINRILQKNSSKLDLIYDFNALLMKDNLVPPVVEIAHDTVNAPDYESIRSSEAEIRIVKPASLVTTAPNWRNYLIMSYKMPPKINPSIYPTTLQEKEMWEKGVAKGWYKGVEQAQDMFEQSLSILNRDFKGMVLYHTLLLQNMITSPYAATASLGITGDQTAMRVNDKVTRITAQAALNASGFSEWDPVIEIDEAS